jgi:hypothetical protein
MRLPCALLDTMLLRCAPRLPIVLVLPLLLGTLLLVVLVLPLLLLRMLLPIVLVLPLLLLRMLLPIVLVLPLLLLRMLLPIVLVLPLLLLRMLLRLSLLLLRTLLWLRVLLRLLPRLLGALRLLLSMLLRLGLLGLTLLLRGMTLLFVLLLVLRINWTSKSEQQRQTCDADDSYCLHESYLHYCRLHRTSNREMGSPSVIGVPLVSYWSKLLSDERSRRRIWLPSQSGTGNVGSIGVAQHTLIGRVAVSRLLAPAKRRARAYWTRATPPAG